MKLHQILSERLAALADKDRAWLAEELHVSLATISRWLTGARLPEVPRLVRLSAVLGLDLAELVEAHARSAKAGVKAEPDDETATTDAA